MSECLQHESDLLEVQRQREVLVAALMEIHRLIGLVRADYHEYEAERQIEELCVAALRSIGKQP